MKYIAVFFAVVIAIGYFATYGVSHPANNRCQGGVAKAYATLQNDPGYLVGTIPNKYTDDSIFFTIRYNCRFGSVDIKRVDLGTYDVRFPNLKLFTAVATVVSDNGSYASVQPINGNEFRVVIRGPVSQANVSLRRDLPFSIVAY